MRVFFRNKQKLFLICYYFLLLLDVLEELELEEDFLLEQEELDLVEQELDFVEQDFEEELLEQPQEELEP